MQDFLLTLARPMALHGVDVTVFTELDRSYQSEQDPVQVCASSARHCMCLRVSALF